MKLEKLTCLALIIISLAACQKNRDSERLSLAGKYEPKDQLDFEQKVSSMHKENRGTEMGTREHEGAYQSELRFIDSVKGKQLNNWICEYNNNTVWNSSAHMFSNGIYIIDCISVGGTIFDSSFELRTTTPPTKVYNKDILKFSGKVRYFNTGAGLGFKMEVENANFEIYNPNKP